MSNFMRWLRGEPLPGDREYDLYERVKRGITKEQQSAERTSDWLNGKDEFKEANRRSKEAEYPKQK